MISRHEHDRQKAAAAARRTAPQPSVSVNERIEARLFADMVARKRDPIAWQRRENDLRQLRAERIADAKTTVQCAACGTKVPWDATKRPTDGMNTTCPVCGEELGVSTADDSFYEPAAMPLGGPRP